MKYPELKGICKYCLYGCNKLEIQDFTGVNNCKNFIQNEKDWYEKYRREVLNANK